MNASENPFTFIATLDENGYWDGITTIQSPDCTGTHPYDYHMLVKSNLHEMGVVCAWVLLCKKNSIGSEELTNYHE